MSGPSLPSRWPSLESGGPRRHQHPRPAAGATERSASHPCYGPVTASAEYLDTSASACFNWDMSENNTNTVQTAIVALADFLRNECGYEGENTDLAFEYAAEAIAFHGGVENLDQDDDIERPLIETIAASPEFAAWIGA